jgi:hypothetical protein
VGDRKQANEAKAVYFESYSIANGNNMAEIFLASYGRQARLVFQE